MPNFLGRPEDTGVLVVRDSCQVATNSDYHALHFQNQEINDCDGLTLLFK